MTEYADTVDRVADFDGLFTHFFFSVEKYFFPRQEGKKWNVEENMPIISTAQHENDFVCLHTPVREHHMLMKMYLHNLMLLHIDSLFF